VKVILFLGSCTEGVQLKILSIFRKFVKTKLVFLARSVTEASAARGETLYSLHALLHGSQVRDCRRGPAMAPSNSAVYVARHCLPAILSLLAHFVTFHGGAVAYVETTNYLQLPCL
jgi:hypothetical protein